MMTPPSPAFPASPRSRAFSLLELLAAVAAIGILAAIASMALRGIRDDGDSTKDRANAQHIAQVSAALGAMGVAHVLPDSLGGAEATARLLRNGIEVSKGPFTGQTMSIKALSDEDLSAASHYLELVYDLKEVRLVYRPHPQAEVPPAPDPFFEALAAAP